MSTNMWVVILGVVTAAYSSSVYADDNVARQLLAEAQQGFDARSSSSLDSINRAIELLSRAEVEAQDALLMYDVLILESRALYFKGTHTAAKSAKKTIHNLGVSKADAAEKVSPNYAEAPYNAGINLARWGEANGMIASVSRLPQLKKYMNSTMQRVTRSGDAGENIDGLGPHRVYGRIYKKLPPAFGGSHVQSVAELRKAAEAAPEVALNIVYLADSLMKDGNADEQAEGRAMLIKLLANDPNTYNMERIVETNDEFAVGRLVLEGKEVD